MDGFKQRIIGAVVIVCLAVIFLPMMFDEPHQERTRESIDIPDQPDFPQVRIERPQTPPEDRERQPVEAPEPRDTAPSSQQSVRDSGPASPGDDDSGSSTPDPAPTVTSTPAASQPDAPDSAALSGSYLVQLGSFGSADNARALRDRVRAKGIQAYVEQFQRGDNTLNRVFAGPFANRSDAESAKSGLDSDLQLSTLIIAAGDND
ncbi:MAG: sporulation protein [Halomonadaceae bacterium]|nr:MAG: sporulation protein [Halomonadaceae bacterium]